MPSHHYPRLLLFGCLLVASLKTMPALAQPASRDFNIPPQALASALKAYADNTNLQLLYPSEIAQGLRSNGVVGRHTPQEALRKLLSGTGVTYRFTDDQTVTLERIAAQDEERLRIEPTTVTGQAESAYGPVFGYKAERSATATKTDTPILETPASIQVVPGEVIEDQGITELNDVYRNVSGVVPGGSFGFAQNTESALIRGFQNFRINRNGLPLESSAPIDLANVERVEVLKGPASFLYGRVEPGGLVNIVTKKPLPEPYYAVDFTAGSYDFYRPTLDVTSPLLEDKSLLYRVNLAYTNAGSFRDFVETERFYVAPILTWRPSDRFDITFEATYQHQTDPFDHGLALSPEGKLISSRSTFLGEPSADGRTFNETSLGYTLDWQATDLWTLRNAFRFQRFDVQLDVFRHFGPTSPDLTVDRSWVGHEGVFDEYQVLIDNIFDFSLGSTDHKLLVGVDYRLMPDQKGFVGPDRFFAFPIDIVDPQYGVGPFEPDAFQDVDFKREWVGVYVQDQVNLLDDRLILLFGGRFDHFNAKTAFTLRELPSGDVFFNSRGELEVNAFTGRAGAMVKATPWLHPYVSVGQSFNPPSELVRSASPLDPERGMLYEAGLKLGELDGPWSATIAAYQITKDNVPVTDPDNPNFSINGGEQRSRGVELDVVGELLPGLSVIANYAYTDTEVLESDFLPIGARFRNVPLHMGSGWLAYDFQPGTALEGFGFGGGVLAVGSRPGDDEDSFDLDSYARLDLGAWYRRDLGGGRALHARLSVQNVTDEVYIESSQNTGSAFPGKPRFFMLTVGYEF